MILFAVSTVGLPFSLSSAWAVENGPPPPPPEDYNVLASGPIHEAFATAVAMDPEPGITAPKEPPDIIDEIAPEQRPEGDVQWIPGYWAWDDDRDGYIWISGFWRVPPPGRQWVPGYWNPVSNGYQWISGYWLSLNDEETEYLPEPPESVEIGPSSNAPSPDYIWIPGIWGWHHGRYAWRPGFWAVAHPDWLWIPSHYLWTPRGYLYVSGYWDHTLPRRGVLFAPVYFTPHFFLGLHHSFSPGFIISLNVFDDALFMRPRYSHYYFGDYYAPRYYQRGIYPWFSPHSRRVVYDPIYAHQRWKHRKEPNWENHLNTRFNERRKHEEMRPSREFDHRNKSGLNQHASGHQRPTFGMSISQAAKAKADVYRFRPTTEKERHDFSRRNDEVRQYNKDRRTMENRSHPNPKGDSVKRSEPDREKTSRSPIMDRSNQKTSKKKSPPNGYREPKSNPNVEPLERRYDNSSRRENSQTRGIKTQDPGNGRKQNKTGQRPVENVQSPENRETRPNDEILQKDNGARQHRENTPQPQSVNGRSNKRGGSSNGKDQQPTENVQNSGNGPSRTEDKTMQRDSNARQIRDDYRPGKNGNDRSGNSDNQGHDPNGRGQRSVENVQNSGNSPSRTEDKTMQRDNNARQIRDDYRPGKNGNDRSGNSDNRGHDPNGRGQRSVENTQGPEKGHSRPDNQVIQRESRREERSREREPQPEIREVKPEDQNMQKESRREERSRENERQPERRSTKPEDQPQAPEATTPEDNEAGN